MNNDMLIAGAIGFAPAMILMFWTLRDYTYPKVEKPFFEDKKAFGLFAVGMVLGVAMYAAQSWFPLQVVYVALAFALVEELVKLMILNFPRFQRKLDTSFYGLAIGLGIGSTMGFGAAFVGLHFVESVSAWTMLIVVLLAVQLVLLNASTGATIGVGVTRGAPWAFFAQATLVHISYSLLMILFYMNPDVLGYAGFFAALAVVVGYYIYVHSRMLPKVVEDGISSLVSKSKS
ncbi:MAG: hypothetical protein LUQ14_02500 [Methanomassiliicoccales archaeon]|nr:hypothetical protein [Methanomassiliicoccales archaeon]